MTCDANTLFSQAAVNGFSKLQDRDLRICLVQILCAFAAAAGPPDLVIDNIDLANNSRLSTAHNLGSVPRQVRLVIKVKVAVGGYSIGYEIDAVTILNPTVTVPPFIVGANATTVWFSSDDNFRFSNCKVTPRTGGASVFIDGTQGSGKLYVWK